MKKNLYNKNVMVKLAVFNLIIKMNVKVAVLLILLIFPAFNISAQVFQPQDGYEIKSISSLDNTASDSENFLDYSFEIRNIENTIRFFQFTTENVIPDGSNPDGSQTNKNVDLSSLIMDASENPVTSITLKPGEKSVIVLRVFIPDSAKTGVWNCTQVKLHSTNSNSVSFVRYSTFIPSPDNNTVGYNSINESGYSLILLACLSR